MKKLEMTNNEIVQSYNNAVSKGMQISILADLNATSPKTIKGILRDAGIELPRGPLPKTKKEDKPMEKVETKDNCEGGVCVLPFVPDKHLPPMEITNVKKPTPRKLWMMARQVELKTYLQQQLNALLEIDEELMQEYNQLAGELK